MLPDACGREVLESIRALHPGVPILLVTGYPEQLDTSAFDRCRVGGFFVKPFQVEAFSRAIGLSLSPLAGSRYGETGYARVRET